MAAQAWPIAAVQRFARSRKELDVFRSGLFGRAGWTAKNAGGSDTYHKNTFESRIATDQGAIHGFRWWEQFHQFHGALYARGWPDRISGIQALNSKVQCGASVSLAIPFNGNRDGCPTFTTDEKLDGPQIAVSTPSASVSTVETVRAATCESTTRSPV